MRTSAIKSGTEELRVDPFLQDVLKGMSEKQKNISPKYFYDEAGSKLFDEICELEEYYPYRTELEMLPAVSTDLAQLIKNDIDVFEFGAGSLVKIRPVLEHLDRVRRYVPIDIAGDHLFDATSQLRDDFEDDEIEVLPIEADFTGSISLPDETDGVVRLGFFPGSTIGNFSPEQAIVLLKEMRESLGNNSWLQIGVDTKKEPWILHRAYNDAKGVTERFNKNLLHRINRELGGTFDPDTFAHYAFYNIYRGRVEMHLVSQDDQEITISGEKFSFRTGETLHTENSYKYTPGEFTALALTAGWKTERTWLDKDRLFSHHLLYSG